MNPIAAVTHQDGKALEENDVDDDGDAVSISTSMVSTTTAGGKKKKKKSKPKSKRGIVRIRFPSSVGLN